MKDPSQAAPLQTAGEVLIMVAVEVERDAVMLGLQGADGFAVALAGVGPAAAAANTAKMLAGGGYRLVVSAGIGGGIPGIAELGSLVVADEIVAADLGVESTDGFLSVDELGFGSTRVPVDAASAQLLAAALIRAGLSAHVGGILTVTTATGTAATASLRSARIPGAAAEAMEGFGAATAAQLFGVPVLELRAISNEVGPRDRSAWRIKEALDSLTAASAVLAEVLR